MIIFKAVKKPKFDLNIKGYKGITRLVFRYWFYDENKIDSLWHADNITPYYFIGRKSCALKISLKSRNFFCYFKVNSRRN